MYRGYVKLWRKIIDSGWLKNHKLLSFWVWCLTKASHKEIDQIVGYQKVNLKPGDFIYGRKAAAEELGMSERSIRTCLDFLKNCQNLTIKTTNKFSVISIVNWESYQSDERSNDQQNDQPPTNKRPTNDHKQECKAFKNEKNIHKAFVLPEWIKKETWDAYREMRTRKRAPLTDRAAVLTVKELEKLKASGFSAEDVLNQSIQKSWTGVFPLSGGNGNGRTDAYQSDKRGRLPTQQGYDDADEITRRRLARQQASDNPGGVSGSDDVPDFPLLKG